MHRLIALSLTLLPLAASADEASSQPAPNERMTPIAPRDAPANLSDLAASGYSGRDNALLHYGTPESFAELHGFIAMLVSQSNAPNSHLNFDLKEAFLSAFAQVNRTVSAYIEFEIQHGDVHLERAFVDWEFLPHVHFQAGKFYAPFGNDKVLLKQPFNKLTTDPFVVHNLAFDDFADIGLSLWGSYRWRHVWARADFAITKGAAGLRDADWSFDENNADKPIFGRLQLGYDGDTVHGLIGASGAYGHYDDPARRSWLLLGAHAQIMVWRFEMVDELFVRRGQDSISTDTCDGHPCVPAIADGIGFYAQLSFHVLMDRLFARDLEAIVRYDQTDLQIPSETGAATRAQRLTLGARWKPYNHFALKAEYDLSRTEPVEIFLGGFFGSVVAEF